MRQKHSKYGHRITKSESRKVNFGSASVKRREVGMPKFNLPDYNDEVVIERIKPVEGPKEDEIHSWGLIRFEDMTREECEKKYGK